MNSQILMAGIDHNTADLEVREKLSLTQNRVKEILPKIKENEKLAGCVLISTCNRTELWISGSGQEEPVLLFKKYISKEFPVPKSAITERQGREAVLHLCKLSGGAESKLFFEEQITGQLKEAAAAAKTAKTLDPILAKLFQGAIAAGKRIRTDMAGNHIVASAAGAAALAIEQHYGAGNSKCCLVIGNGQMGKLVAEELLNKGHRVNMTLRKKIHGCQNKESLIISGCNMVPYEERFQAVAEADIIVSATRSPHYTVAHAEIEEIQEKAKGPGRLFIDLALPRDVDPKISQLPGVELIHLDQLTTGASAERQQQVIAQVDIITEEYAEDFYAWLKKRELAPKVKKAAGLVAKDGLLRAELNLPQDMEKTMEKAFERAVTKVILGLEEKLGTESMKKFVDAFYEAARKETLKK